MKDQGKTKERLIKELNALRRKLAEAEATKIEVKRIGEEMKKAVVKANEEKARTEAIIAAIGDGISIQDTHFKVLYQNQVHKNLVGGDKAGDYCYLAFARSSHVCEGCPVALAFKDGKIHTLEKTAPRDGGVMHIEIKASPLRDSAGKVIGGIEVVRDITGRKRVEKALKESEKRYRTLFESAGDGIFILDAEGEKPGRIVAANQAAAEMHGYTVDELLTLTIADLDIPDDANKVPERIRCIVKGGRVKAEVTHRRKNGTLFPVEVSAGLLELGNKEYVLAFDRDITKRKLAEDALHESEAKHRIVSDNTYAWEFWLSAEDTFLYSSPSCKRITGYDAEVFMTDANVLCHIIHPDDRPRFESHRHKVVQEKVSEEVEFRIIRQDGTVRWINHVCQPVFDNEGRFMGTRGSNRDVTEQKWAEQEREKLILELRDALAKIKTLSGLLPICAWCKKIRDDQGYWKKVEEYVEEHSDAHFTHGICPECLKENSPEVYENLQPGDKRKKG